MTLTKGTAIKIGDSADTAKMEAVVVKVTGKRVRYHLPGKADVWHATSADRVFTLDGEALVTPAATPVVETPTPVETLSSAVVLTPVVVATPEQRAERYHKQVTFWREQFRLAIVESDKRGQQLAEKDAEIERLQAALKAAQGKETPLQVEAARIYDTSHVAALTGAGVASILESAPSLESAVQTLDAAAMGSFMKGYNLVKVQA